MLFQLSFLPVSVLFLPACLSTCSEDGSQIWTQRHGVPRERARKPNGHPCWKIHPKSKLNEIEKFSNFSTQRCVMEVLPFSVKPPGSVTHYIVLRGVVQYLADGMLQTA